LLRSSIDRLGAGRSILLDRKNRIIAGNKPCYVDVIIARYEAVTGKKATLYGVKETKRTKQRQEQGQTPRSSNAAKHRGA
jgi:hypothetical protein